MLEMLSIPTMWLNCNKNLSELLWLAILFSAILMCQEDSGFLGIMIMGKCKQTRSEVKLFKSKETAFQERDRTNKQKDFASYLGMSHF